MATPPDMSQEWKFRFVAAVEKHVQIYNLARVPFIAHCARDYRRPVLAFRRPIREHEMHDPPDGGPVGVGEHLVWRAVQFGSVLRRTREL